MQIISKRQFIALAGCGLIWSACDVGPEGAPTPDGTHRRAQTQLASSAPRRGPAPSLSPLHLRGPTGRTESIPLTAEVAYPFTAGHTTQRWVDGTWSVLDADDSPAAVDVAANWSEATITFPEPGQYTVVFTDDDTGESVGMDVTVQALQIVGYQLATSCPAGTTGMQITVAGASPASTVTLQSSADLQTWLDVESQPGSDGNLQFVHCSSSGPGFYRAAIHECPPGCDQCYRGVCEIEAEGDEGITCPPGMPCFAICGSADEPCHGAIDCGDAFACTVLCGPDGCDGGVSCGGGDCRVSCDDGACASGIECGTGECSVSCVGDGCNGGVTCNDADLCAVSCFGDPTCQAAVSCGSGDCRVD